MTLLHRVDARMKILATLGILIAAVTTRTADFPACVPSFMGYFLIIGTGLVTARVFVATLCRRLLLVAPLLMACALCVPLLHNGISVLENVALKSIFGVLCVTLLTETTPMPDILRALEQFCCPRLLILLAGFTYRYLFVFADEARRLRRALDCRCFDGRWLWHTRALGRMLGTLFLRSYERGERVYIAMVSRGFDGVMHVGETRSLRRGDYAFVATILSMTLMLKMI